ncbi:hypothetical protein [Burkholderia plantarii]|uniref:hypothetical protein n=1 Tax=Burkholderia plantarii TaxID=41899 RepID=UPI000B2027E2|nr:hypothetical protein [Burkholderia plantarii]
MSSIAFIEVEGRFTMPPSRSSAPSSYGHEWALLPPEAESRTGIRSLYAAIVRTACLDVDAFLALYRWDGEQDGPFVSATIAAAAHAIPAAQAPDEIKPREATRVAAEPFPRTARPIGLFKAPRYRAARCHSRSFRRIAGRIGIVGAAMLLGWIVIDHVPSHPEGTTVIHASRDAADGSGSRSPASNTPPQVDTHVAPRRDLADATANPRRTPIAKHADTGARLHDDSLRDQARAGTEPARADSRRHASSHAVDLARESARAGATIDSGKPARRPSRSTISHGVKARPTAIASDDFDINAYADLADELRQRDSMSARDDKLPASTEWTEQISQRRLTDIPEQFVK